MAAPRAVREAAHAGEGVVRVARLDVLFRCGLDFRLASIAEDRIAALDVLDETFDSLRVELHLPWTLRDRDRLFSPRAGEEDVVSVGRLHEAPAHGDAGMLRAEDRLAGPVGLSEIS